MKTHPIYIGSLDRRIEVYKQATTADGAGGLTQSSNTLQATVWGGVKSVNAVRIDDFGREYSVSEYEFTFRTKDVSTYTSSIADYNFRLDSTNFKMLEIIDKDLDQALTTVRVAKI